MQIKKTGVISHSISATLHANIVINATTGPLRSAKIIVRISKFFASLFVFLIDSSDPSYFEILFAYLL